MSDNAVPDDEYSRDEADRRRDEVLKRMLNTPPQPKKKGREPKPAPSSKR